MDSEKTLIASSKMAFAWDQSIFLAALEKPYGPKRDSFVAEACAGDDQLLANVQELLRAHHKSGNFLDELPSGVAPRDPGTAISVPIIVEDLGSVIGPYKLVERIAEGGFGLVFVAEQQQPVRRKVALKIIKPGMDTRDVIARFEAERQALAMMDHPNIARVYDAGATASGRPFFVMELVRGIPINEFCDKRQLTLVQRLQLFNHVCHAVQHAHLKGVIHRDLKPSNVLVTLHDTTPVPKVIDFGVAKAISHSLTDKTIYTRFTQMIGTPLYMSPEQAEMSGLDIDTRSDIYSLGVMLYELLTGTTPADPKRLYSAPFDEVRRIIREEEPPKPSTRLTTLGQALSTVSSKRNIEPRKLTSFVRGDLDWIVMKALEKDRRRRYETASAFAADIQHFLNREPIEARPPSAIYRFQKFARRNVVFITTASLVFAALILGMAVSIWQAGVARDAQRKALAEGAEKERALSEAELLRARAEGVAARLKSVNTLLASARANTDGQRWLAAHYNYSQAIDAAPEFYFVWQERGLLYARLSLWDLAAADFRKTIELGGLTPSQFNAMPELLRYVGDEDGYRLACQRLLNMLGSTDDRSTLRVVRSCMIKPGLWVDPEKFAERAENAIATMQPMPPHYFAVALAHYRATNYKKALQRVRQAMAPGGPGMPSNYALLAMVQYRMGKVAEASKSLAAVEKAIDGWYETRAKGQIGADASPWFEWIVAALLYSEAKVLITTTSPPYDPRQDVIEQRSTEAIYQGSP